MTLRVAVLGATGYGGGELLRFLLQRHDVALRYATSRTESGVPVGRVHRNLDGLTDLAFSAPTDDELTAEVDVVFGALPHGASATTLGALVDRGVAVIDLSGDFRLRSSADYDRWYKGPHPRPDLLGRAIYGCPEANRDALRTARFVAAPGCFATAINLALLPLAKARQITGTPHIVAMTGSSGSGAGAGEGTHHPTRAQTLRPYKVLAHQHTPEIVQLARDMGAEIDRIAFTPVSAPLVRGILAVVHLPTARIGQAELDAMVSAAYATHPFVKVLRDREPECASVAGTNYAELRARVADDGVHVVVAIDNLLKGGAGQAMQAMNLMFGLDETAGLRWMGSWP